MNKYANGNTNITNLNKEIINGFRAYLIDWRMPWMATEILMNIKPILDILSAVVHTFIISLFMSLARPKSFANG